MQGRWWGERERERERCKDEIKENGGEKCAGVGRPGPGWMDGWCEE